MTEVKVNTITVTDASSYHDIKIDVPLNLKSYSTSARNSLTSVAGDIIYNSDDNKAQFYNGCSWSDL